VIEPDHNERGAIAGYRPSGYGSLTLSAPLFVHL
jgi:hypothetical protein